MSSYIDANSRQAIVDNEEVDHVTITDEQHLDDSDNNGNTSNTNSVSRWLSIISIGVLCCINLLNYMDRFTVAAVLQSIQKSYSVSNTLAGLLQTSFIVSYMLLSPLFGYLGDRATPGGVYSRKGLMLVGIVVWSGVTLASSFVPDDYFWLFMLTRCLVGVGEASYNTLATPIVADLFVGNARTFALVVFNLQVPLGSGLGYVIGSQVPALAHNDWRWALRVTPPLGIVCVLLLLLLFREPQRGEAERATHVQVTDWRQDIRQLLRNRSFLLNTLGFTAVAFVTGALSWWTPTLLRNDIERKQAGPAGSMEAAVQAATLTFGAITCIAGIAGVFAGTELARRLRPTLPNADPLVCGAGLLLAAPCMFATLLSIGSNLVIAFVLVFITELFLCVNWALVNEITLKVTVPTRRSMANSLSILLSHLLGDASSPYLIGLVSDLLARTQTAPKSAEAQFMAQRFAMYTCCFVCAAGGAAFLACSLSYVNDCARVLRIEQAAARFYAEEGVSYEPPSLSSTDDLSGLGVGGNGRVNRAANAIA